MEVDEWRKEQGLLAADDSIFNVTQPAEDGRSERSCDVTQPAEDVRSDADSTDHQSNAASGGRSCQEGAEEENVNEGEHNREEQSRNENEENRANGVQFCVCVCCVCICVCVGVGVCGYGFLS